MSDETLSGSCHCGATGWTLRGDPGGITACNCTLCRRYGTLWAYDYEGEGIHVTGPTTAHIRGKALGFHFCATCGCVAFWRSLQTNDDGRRRCQPAPERARGGRADSDRALRRPGDLRRPGTGRPMRRRLLVLS